MNKNKIAIAVFAVITAVSSARAQNVVDFDNRALSANHSGTNRIVVFDPDSSPTPTPVPPPTPSPWPPIYDIPARSFPGIPDQTMAGALKMYNLDATGTRDLRAIKSLLDVLDEKTTTLINDDNTGIMYNGEKVIFTKDMRNGEFSIISESTNHRLITALLAINSKQFAVQVLGSSSSTNKVFEHGPCIHTHTEKKCGYQLACELVCGAAAGAAGSGTGPLGGAVVGAGAVLCVKVCNNVEQCHDVDVCDQYAY